MKSMFRYIYLFCFVIILVSCKNESKDSDSKTINPAVEKTKKTLTNYDKKVISSLLTKAMTTPESKSFVSAMVSAGLTKTLSDQEGPFTVFAPSNKVFNEMIPENKKRLFNSKNKDSLSLFINSLIVEGNYKIVDLESSIKENGGNLKMKSLNGTTLTASKKGKNIVIKDEKGNKAVIEKSDIEGSNGVLHIIDAILVFD